ncbi:Uncharacterized protein TPAR_02035 [Tolypocladium paradoxum]|uniref:Uncharacterized protein n=1 Tax=Tolypocladium paradoxum TaxID=94208 RepID=A0A2S4L5R2_9HYPO|nr:Uncharacterized protein TPAR_02035 [Tolypocladium paradoxum]
MSTINVVKYYFYRKNMPSPEEMQKMIALAYQTARDRKLYPKAVLIRSHLHNTTSSGGKHRKDPKGWHITLCYKDARQLAGDRHVASHGYVTDTASWAFREATHAGEKADSTIKSSGKPVWPSDPDELWAAPEIGYGHFPEEQ